MMSKDCKFQHAAVLFDVCMAMLAIRPDGTYVDCTAGAGGHSTGIAARLNAGGRLIALDKDPAAVERTGEELAALRPAAQYEVLQHDFAELDTALDRYGAERVDGILADLGVSSHQLDIAERGFSYANDGPLDMRMDPGASLSAADVIARYPEKELTRIFRLYGEERYAGRIANAIVKRRDIKPFENTGDLAQTIVSAMPPQARKEAQHPARRVFQAIRIEVNGELDAIRTLLASSIGRLADNGRLCIISFHSLEDRLVKEAFRSWENPCTCPRDFPQCVCGAVPLGRVVTRRPLYADKDEIARNPRARSAKLRVFERRIVT